MTLGSEKVLLAGFSAYQKASWIKVYPIVPSPLREEG